MSAGQIYVKMLPDGEARSLTNDARVKYNLAFSPDGSQIAYTVSENPVFSTYTISVLGGDSHLLLSSKRPKRTISCVGKTATPHPLVPARTEFSIRRRRVY